jgi:beta-lactamase class C
MKILKEIVLPKKLITFTVRQLIQPVALGLCVLFPGTHAYAQTEKQISYPVAVPIERAAASSVAAPVIKAPEPVIRSIDDASTTPPPVRKASAKKIVAEKPDEKAAKTSTAKKAGVKPAATTATKSNTNTTKKTVAEKPKPVNKTAAPIKNAQAANTTQTPANKSAPTPSVKKNAVTTSTKPEAEKIAAPSSPATNTLVVKPEKTAEPTISTAIKAAIVPVAAVSVIKPALAEDEESQLNASLNEEDFSAGPEVVADTKPSSAVTSFVPVKNVPLPMSNQREGFVTEFKNYVETRIVPRVPGAAVAIIADGKVKVLQAYGVKKIGGNDPINTDTAFRLASVSKTIAGTAAGVLVNDGLITWDTPIVSVLPNIEFSNPRYGNQLTLRNIMSQSSGLPTHAGDNFIEDGLPFDEVVQKLKTINFVCPPGKCYSYQNVTLSLLGSIIYKKTGKPYEQYVKEKIFAPLGMRSASIGLEGLLATKNYALPHEVSARGQWYTKEITQNYYRLNPAAGGNASITDMAHWVLAQMGHNPDVLSPATLQAIHAKVTKNTAAQSHYGAREGVTDTHYGMGWRTFDYRGDKNFLHHGGYVFGSRSEMVFNPELQIGMVILSNCNKLPGDVIFQFLDAYEDEKRGEKRPVAQAVQAIKKKVKQK